MSQKQNIVYKSNLANNRKLFEESVRHILPLLCGNTSKILLKLHQMTLVHENHL